MLGMSTADILGSLAMGLSTLPMPRGSSAELGYNYEWAGTRLGNVHTCNAQGFFFIFGQYAMFAYTGFLCVYYALAIAFRMREDRIIKYWEPFFHAGPLILGLTASVYPLASGNIHPSGWEAWCTLTYKHTDNTKGTEATSVTWDIWFLLIFLIIFLLSIVLNFGFIIWTVAKTERALKRAVRARDHNLHNNDPQRRQLQRIGEIRSNQAQQNAIRSMQNTRVVVIQALAYFISFLIALSMPILRNLPRSLVGNLKDPENELIILRLQIVLMPLQGLFNALIFIYHKIYNYRRIHPDVSRCHVLKLVFSGKADDEVLFSRISMLSVNGDNSVDINIHNERNEDKHIFIHGMSNAQKEDFGSFDEEVFVDEGEESQYNLSGFSSRLESSTGLSLKNIDTDNAIDGDLDGENGVNEEEVRSNSSSLESSNNNLSKIASREGSRISSLSSDGVSGYSSHVAGFY